RADQNIARMPADFDEIIRHNHMTALHEFQSALGFSRARLTDNQHTEPVHHDEHAVHDGGRRQTVFEISGELANEIGCGAGGSKNGNAVSIALIDNFRCDLAAMRDDDARKIFKSKHDAERGKTAGVVERLEVGVLALTEDLNSLGAEIFHVAGERKT